MMQNGPHQVVLEEMEASGSGENAPQTSASPMLALKPREVDGLGALLYSSEESEPRAGQLKRQSGILASQESERDDNPIYAEQKDRQSDV